MNGYLTFCLFVVLAVCSLVQVHGTEGAKTPIEHVIVLMLENRSFDHYLGYLKSKNAAYDGCLPGQAGCSNPANPDDASSQVYEVTSNAVNSEASPSHSVHGTTEQIFSHTATPTVADMQGFIKSYAGHGGEANPAQIMDCFAPEHVPILATLAEEFLTFDGWFASVPGPTLPNRAYAAAASSHGMATCDTEAVIRGLPNKTMFRQLEEMGLDWRVYFELIPAVLMFKDMRHKDARPRYRYMTKFYEDVAAGDLPQYTWIEPNYHVTPKMAPDDQHPDHDIANGEQLVKNVYEALRASPLWNTSALIITYDEHGGFFDHVVPPNPIPSPDNIVATDDPFDFTRSGIRVPTVVASPWVGKGAIEHAKAAGEGQYEHSSLVSTVVHKMFTPAKGHPPQGYLNARDQWAATFEHTFNLKQARTDCPTTLPEPHYTKPYVYKQTNLTDLQKEMLVVVAGATEDKKFSWKGIDKWTDVEALSYINKRFDGYFQKQKPS